MLGQRMSAEGVQRRAQKEIKEGLKKVVTGACRRGSKGKETKDG
jgi:hypothetical protein